MQNRSLLGMYIIFDRPVKSGEPVAIGCSSDGCFHGVQGSRNAAGGSSHGGEEARRAAPEGLRAGGGEVPGRGVLWSQPARTPPSGDRGPGIQGGAAHRCPEQAGGG